MAGSLEGRKAIVTGASSGIGEATAAALAAEGASVALGARRKEKLDEIVKRIEGEGGKAIAVEADVGDEEQAKNLVASTVEEFGGVDILVNNAGVMLLGLVYGADTEEWRRMIDVNCLGLLYCTHEVLPVMGNGRGGHIVNVASTAGRNAYLGSAVYNMTKFGVVGFSEALRQEALNVNVRVTCVEPGYVDTELQGHNTNPMVVERMEEMRKEMKEVLAPEDIANAIVYAVKQPEHVNVNEVLVRPTAQGR